MAKNYWLFKSEPSSYSIDDLQNAKNQTTTWEGVRNYQARNILRDDVKRGDRVLFYHSNANPPGVAGTATVVRAGYPDETAVDPNSDYYDPKASKDEPRWYTVDVKLDRKFDRLVPLSELKETRGLEEMMVTQKGARLSIQPVRKTEWDIILKLADKPGD